MSSAAIGRLEKALAIQRAETRRQAELWLAAHTRNDDSLRIFQSLYEDAPVGYVTLSRSGNVVDVNNKVAALLEREPRAIRGRPLLFFIHRSSTDRFLRHVAGCREGAESITSEVVLRVGPDHTIPVELISTRTTLLDGTIGYQTIVNDLSVREAIQRAIAASEKRYREIVETANDGAALYRRPIEPHHLFEPGVQSADRSFPRSALGTAPGIAPCRRRRRRRAICVRQPRQPAGAGTTLSARGRLYHLDERVNQHLARP